MFTTLYKRRGRLAASLAALAFGCAAGGSQAAASPPDQYLPWATGVSHSVMQGNNGGYSHTRATTRYGWDFALRSGEEVRTGIGGVVQSVRGGCRATRSRGCNDGYGNTVSIRVADGTCARFEHLSGINPALRRDLPVGRYALIGSTGSSGDSDGVHLHYQREKCANGVALPSSFIEAGVPRTGDVVRSANRSPEDWTALNVSSSNVLDVTAGDRVTAVVTSTYLGQVPIPCGQLNLGVRGDAPARFADLRDGVWPSSPWRAPNRVAAVGCFGSLMPGQQARWDLTFRPPANAGAGTVLTGVYSPVWEGHRWYDPGAAIALRITSCAYRAGYEGQQQPALVAPGETGHILVAIRNNGCETWRRGEVNLGTRGDQPFPYANDSWKGGHNRLFMTEESVAPGEIAHFEGDVAVPADAKAGQFKQYLALVAEGRQWFAQEMGIYVPIYVGDCDHIPFTGDQYHADYVGQTNADPLDNGEETRVKVTFRNTGPAVLCAGGEAPVHLRATPGDRQSKFVDASAPEAVGGSQGARMDQERVDPGEEVSFTLPVKVSDDLAPGNYKEYFRPVAEGKAWFGTDGMYWPFEVRSVIVDPPPTEQPPTEQPPTEQPPATTPPPTTEPPPVKCPADTPPYRAGYEGQQQSPLVAPGETGHIRVALKNTGCETWDRGKVNLGTKGDAEFPYADDSWKGGHNRLFMTEETVRPGEVAHFEGDIAVPADAKASQLKQYMAPVAEGKQWFGQEMGIYVPIFVGDKDHIPFTADQYDVKYVSQTNAGPLHNGDTTRVKVTFRNTGQAVLFADGAGAPVHLRATPNDRQSAFVDPSAPEAVGGAQGARMDQERVDPGEELSFTLPVKVHKDLGPGTYKEPFRPVAEGKTWFGPVDMYWPFEVR